MCTVWERKPRQQYYSSFSLEHNATLTYYAATEAGAIKGDKHYAAIREIIAKKKEFIFVYFALPPCWYVDKWINGIK